MAARRKWVYARLFPRFCFFAGRHSHDAGCGGRQVTGYWDRPERAQGAIFRSRDLAESWVRVGTGDCLPENMQQMVWALTQHPENPSIVYAGLGAVSRGRSADATQKGHGDILISEDQGDNWERLPLDLPADRVLFVSSDN